MKNNFSYWKGLPSWKNSIFIIGLPRSGKSTIFNFLSSCKNVQGLEEPLDLLSIAQQSSRFKDKEILKTFEDLFLALMEYHFSELTLGRSYNFRECDKSYIMNFKSIQEVETSFSLKRRVDVIDYLKDKKSSFIIVFNDIEMSLKFLKKSSPNPTMIYIQRKVKDVALEIFEKGWLSDEQLASQFNLMPAYDRKINSNGIKIFIPYLIPACLVKYFISLNTLGRSYMFAYVQDLHLKKNIKKEWRDSIRLNFEDLVSDPYARVEKLVDKIGLVRGDLYFSNIEKWSKEIINLKSSDEKKVDTEIFKKIQKKIDRYVK